MQYDYDNTMEENNKEHTNIQYTVHHICTLYITKLTGVYTCILQLSHYGYMLESSVIPRDFNGSFHSLPIKNNPFFFLKIYYTSS